MSPSEKLQQHFRELKATKQNIGQREYNPNQVINNTYTEQSINKLLEW